MASTVEYEVSGMTCEHCRAAVTAELRAVPGVHEVDVNLESKRVVVTGSSLDDKALRAAIEDAGYEASA